MAPIKINKIIAATFFMVLVIMSCALTSTLACQANSRKCNRMTASCHKYARLEKCCCTFHAKRRREKPPVMAPVKINKFITATFFMILVIMSCALTSTLACQGGTECTIETPHCTMDSCNAKCKAEATSRKCNSLTVSCHKYATLEKCCCTFHAN
uniref:Uncharacterized protein n=1 Tax=Oryza nivara TaxID=4536 RepID=A0A0E0J752_ORYNI